MATLFFLHIPKCAGMTLTDALLERLPAGDVYQSTSMIRNIRENRPEFLNITNHLRLKAVVGHWLHEAMLPLLAKPLIFATSLRHPVERTKSQYQFDVGLRGGNWPRQDTQKFLAANRNVMTNFLIRAYPSVDADNPSRVERCKAIVSGMDYLFDISDADMRIPQLLDQVGAESGDVTRSNASAGINAHLDVSDDEIAANCAEDLELFEWFMGYRAKYPNQRNPVFDRDVRAEYYHLARANYDEDKLVDYLAPKLAAEIHFAGGPDMAQALSPASSARFSRQTEKHLQRLRRGA